MPAPVKSASRSPLSSPERIATVKSAPRGADPAERAGVPAAVKRLAFRDFGDRRRRGVAGDGRRRVQRRDDRGVVDAGAQRALEAPPQVLQAGELQQRNLAVGAIRAAEAVELAADLVGHEAVFAAVLLRLEQRVAHRLVLVLGVAAPTGAGHRLGEDAAAFAAVEPLRGDAEKRRALLGLEREVETRRVCRAQAMQQQEGVRGFRESKIRAARENHLLQRPVLDPAQHVLDDPHPGRLVRAVRSVQQRRQRRGRLLAGAQAGELLLEAPLCLARRRIGVGGDGAGQAPGLAFAGDLEPREREPRRAEGGPVAVRRRPPVEGTARRSSAGPPRRGEARGDLRQRRGGAAARVRDQRVGDADARPLEAAPALGPVKARGARVGGEPARQVHRGRRHREADEAATARRRPQMILQRLAETFLRQPKLTHG